MYSQIHVSVCVVVRSTTVRQLCVPTNALTLFQRTRSMMLAYVWRGPFFPNLTLDHQQFQMGKVKQRVTKGKQLLYELDVAEIQHVLKFASINGERRIGNCVPKACLPSNHSGKIAWPKAESRN